MSSENRRIENLITEDDLRELFGVSKSVITRLRLEEGLPYLRISTVRRLYLESDIMGWLESRRRARKIDV